MSIKDDTHTNFSPGPKDALPSESNAELPQHDYPGALRTPKKMRLERMNLSGTTSAVLQAIRKKRTEHVLDEQTGAQKQLDISQHDTIEQPVLPRPKRQFLAGHIHEYFGQTSDRKQYDISLDDTIELVALPQVNLTFLNEYTSVPQFKTSVPYPYTHTAKTSKLDALKQLRLKNIYNQILADPLYRNSLFNMASTFILGGLGFVFWIIIARLYKTENVGIATTLISIMTLLSSFTILGLNSSLNRYLPKSTNRNKLINSSFVVVTFFTLLASIIFLLGLRTFSPQLAFLQSNILYGISFTAFVVFCSWNILVESIFMAFRAAGNILIKNSAISILKLVLPFALIGLGAYGVFASTASAFALGVFISLTILIFKFKVKFSLSFTASLLKETLAYSFANYIADFMFNMPSLVLPVIILNVLSAKYAAYYYVASMIQSILLIIPLAASQALLTEGSYNEDELKRHVKKALTTILVILLPATAVIVFGGNLLLQAFGKNYANEAFQFLQLYSVSTIFTSLLLIANAIMNVKHRIKAIIVSNIFAAILTLALSYAFISGKLVGVGWGWLLGQAIAGLVSLFFIIRSLYVQRNAR